MRSALKTQEIASSDDPLYRRIQNALRERVVQGVWKAGESLPPRRRLCTEFGTTRVTLDKAIRELVREGVLRSAQGSGTFVASASDTAPNRALRLGVILERGSFETTDCEEPWSDNFYFGPLFQGIRNGVAGKSVEVVYAHLTQSEYHRFHQDCALDGMIVIAPSQDELPTLHTLAAAGVTFVAVGISSTAPADAKLPCVDTDNRQGASVAVQHLLDLGHRRIALINLALSHANHQDRLEGYRRTLAAAGMAVAPDDLVLFSTYTESRFEECVETWMERAKRSGTLPTAIFACDYQMTLATLRVLRRHGLRVPEDISVVGFDDPLSAAHLTPPLTTVRQPVYRLGYRAALRLLQSVQGDTESAAAHGMEILPNELVVRESTCPPKAAATTEREKALS